MDTKDMGDGVGGDKVCRNSNKTRRSCLSICSSNYHHLQQSRNTSSSSPTQCPSRSYLHCKECVVGRMKASSTRQDVRIPLCTTDIMSSVLSGDLLCRWLARRACNSFVASHSSIHAKQLSKVDNKLNSIMWRK